jgi:hypothetical protein
MVVMVGKCRGSRCIQTRSSLGVSVRRNRLEQIIARRPFAILRAPSQLSKPERDKRISVKSVSWAAQAAHPPDDCCGPGGV